MKTQTMTLRLSSFLAVAALLAAYGANAFAGLTTYTNRTDFLANLPGVGVLESFEDEPLDVQAGSRTITTSTSDIKFLGDSSATFGVSDEVIGGRFPTDGDRYLQVGIVNTSSTVLFKFGGPIRAFGVDVVDKNNNDLDGRIDDLTQNGSVDPGAEGNIQFWGVIATPDLAFTNVGFTGQGVGPPGDTFALDNVVYVVPEPAAAGMLLFAAMLFPLRRAGRRS